MKFIISKHIIMPRRKKLTGRVRRTTHLSSNAKKEVRAIARKVARSMPEVKNTVFLEENIQLYHNKVLYLGKWLACQQGTADPNDASSRLMRVGDELLLRNINVRFWLSNKSDRPNVMYKAYLFWYDTGATLSDTFNYFTNTNKMIDRVNNENISVIDQKTIFSQNNYAVDANNHERSQLCTLKASWKGKKIIYDEGGQAPKKRDLGVMIVCYDAYGTLQTDNIASLAYNGTVAYQDP